MVRSLCDWNQYLHSYRITIIWLRSYFIVFLPLSLSFFLSLSLPLSLSFSPCISLCVSLFLSLSLSLSLSVPLYLSLSLSLPLSLSHYLSLSAPLCLHLSNYLFLPFTLSSWILQVLCRPHYAPCHSYGSGTAVCCSSGTDRQHLRPQVISIASFCWILKFLVASHILESKKQEK